MIKFFGLIARRADVTEQWFHDHYRHPHGTLGFKNRGYVGYVQSHQIPVAADPCPVSQFEAVAEVWFDDLDTALGLADDPHYLQFVKPDEPLFVDLDRLQWLYTDETLLRLRRPGARQQADIVWLSTTAPTTVKVLQFLASSDPLVEDELAATAVELGALRATRCTPVAEVYADESPAFAVVRELWWPTQTALADGVAASPAAWSRLLDVPSGSESLVAQAERFI